jgi:uncharacterized membrane protein SpoIIM required for sporulation
MNLRYPSFWTNASQKRKRIYSIIIIFILVVIITIIGSSIPLNSQDARMLSDQVNRTLNEGKAHNTLTQDIFVNNFFIICLPMFIPIVGVVWGFFVMFDTGLALNAISSVQGYPVWFGFLNLMLSPVFWLEFTAYSIAMAESIWLTRRLLQHRWLEVKNTAIFIAFCAGILIVGAIVEVWLINLVI